MNQKMTKDSKIKTKSTSQDSIPSFIRKTYDILEERKFPDIIDWNSEGTALVIKKPTDFCLKVLPAYFKHNNLTSFVRQLNMYNFHKRRTQNLDHIYYHELFQKGKKQLLKEIRRKSHENTAEKAQKSPEASETGQTQEYSTLSYENQFLKKLYNEAMSKISMLENQIKDVTNQNQSLWTKICQQDQLAPQPQTTLTQEQIPMNFGAFAIPPLKLKIEHQPSSQNFLPLAKAPCVSSYFSFGEEATESTATEISQGSPSIHQSAESDKGCDMSENGQLSQLSLDPQVAEAKPRINNNLMISRQEMSVGQIFEAWKSMETTEQETQESSVLGKRQFEQSGDCKFSVPEPAMKRHELNIFSKKGNVSNGMDEREMFKMMIRRESSINNEEIETNGLDLMDFNNNPFCGWAKTAY